MKNNGFKVISLSKSFYMKPDEYLNGWAKKCGWKASLVYDSLWRHADRSREAYPSYKLMAEEFGLSEATIKRGINTLEDFHIISKSQKKSSKGKFLHNTYILLSKEHWSDPVGLHRPTVNRRSVQHSTVGLRRPIKDTHIKDTHIISKEISKPMIYGNPEINEIIEFLKEKMELPRLDLSQQINRQYANLLLKRSKSGADGVKWLIGAASQDGWYKNHITSFKDLWNNQVKIVANMRGAAVNKKGGFVSARV